ncbi:hypothetical protein DUNSADRAFT_4509 [Dunaliella salina]|uniref:Encoded protein n=1 Tax=Dunaliella salina TaxID=3046 RepID=A0ABQ7GRY1_DUNSA|nr:hypothetical protein DUNSADRAFT_4509 [Dunaliella salina]|eukprot:KAF5837350.1 hypothetical protein DUNSADRAFT_4509 [Dunaliella salina]
MPSHTSQMLMLQGSKQQKQHIQFQGEHSGHSLHPPYQLQRRAPEAQKAKKEVKMEPEAQKVKANTLLQRAHTGARQDSACMPYRWRTRCTCLGVTKCHSSPLAKSADSVYNITADSPHQLSTRCTRHSATVHRSPL